MTRTLTIYCDEASCRRSIVWEPDGVNPSPEGWDSIVDDDEVLDACPEHGPFEHPEPYLGTVVREIEDGTTTGSTVVVPIEDIEA